MILYNICRKNDVATLVKHLELKKLNKIRNGKQIQHTA